jgi:hypothetical protein
MPEPNHNVASSPRDQPIAWRLLRWCLPLAAVLGIVLAISTASTIVLALIVPQIRQLFQDSSPNPPTLGDIRVNTPKVYTRERLVNDRFRQQAWLDSQLQRTEELLKGRAFAGIEGRSRWRERRGVGVVVGLGESVQESDAQTAEGGPDETTQAVTSDRDTFVPEPMDEFRDALVYRDEIRAELMRTQLDDRHDLQGNTLYRLDFDVAIAPGDNTRASANIIVEVEEDDRPEERLTQYAVLYAEWHKLLQMMINSAIRAQTEEILSGEGHLDGPEQVPLQEFIARELCRAFSKIVTTGEDAISCEEVNSAVQQVVAESISAHIQALQDDRDQASLNDLVEAVKEYSTKSDLPKPLRALLSEDKNNANPREPLSRVQQEALSYARGKCSNKAQEGQFYLKENSLSKEESLSVPQAEKVEPKPVALPCPYVQKPLEPLWGAITTLERVRLLGNLFHHRPPKFENLQVADPANLIKWIRCLLVDPDGLEKRSTSDSLRKLPEGCLQLFNALRSAASQVSQKDDSTLGDHLRGLPRVREAFVRQLIAEYMAAKLNDELRSWRVLSPIKNFFNLRLGRCELEACTVVLESKIRVNPEREGWLAFDDTVLKHLRDVLNDGAHTFAYTVTPTEMVQRLASEASRRATLHAVLRTKALNRDTVQTVLSGLQDLQQEIDMRYRNPIIVGFGTPPAVGAEQPKAVFGWDIRPRLMPQQEAGDKVYRQTARHYPLSAVISVPSWWKSLKIVVRTQWVDSDSTESPKRGRESYFYNYIQVPGSVREIKEKLRYEVRKEPYIAYDATGKYGTKFLEMGRPARIILVGGRLWRSTVVTIGDQQADKIEVLPDMTGIIAEFKCVRPPPGESGTKNVDEESYVTVWTSEGVTAAPWPVWLRQFTPRIKSDKNGSEDKNIKDVPCFLEGTSRDKKEDPPEARLLLLPHQARDR